MDEKKGKALQKLMKDYGELCIRITKLEDNNKFKIVKEAIDHFINQIHGQKLYFGNDILHTLFKIRKTLDD